MTTSGVAGTTDGVAGTTDGRASGRVETDADGDRWYRIDDVHTMEPFLMTVVSPGDLWLFVSSAGPLTAGRVDAEHALLPYETDDRLHRSAGTSGPVTVVARTVDGVRELWRPYDRDLDGDAVRWLSKRAEGDALVMAERHSGWGLELRCTWAPSPRFGWVRTVELVDLAGVDHDLEVLDGLVDLMPPDVLVTLEQARSNLVDAYKRHETTSVDGATLHHLESLVTDRAEPAEALSATLVWSDGPDGAGTYLDERVVGAMVEGHDHPQNARIMGRRGSHLRRGRVRVPADGTVTWRLVADTALGHAEVADRLDAFAAADATARVEADVADGHRRLAALLDEADGQQATGDVVADVHHRSNVLFNAMRGGVFPNGHDVPTHDLAAFLAVRNRAVHDRHAAQLPAGSVPLEQIHGWAEDRGDPDLVRLVLEYLPLTFSRRHGDPSRPWNRFSIRVRDDDGRALLTYEGNWRDVFQNWEALLRSYPAWSPHAVAVFVDASTIDGHNPYRVSRAGIDWEVPDADDPWSNIGYWGDHQVVYLHRLLEGWRAVDPDGPAAWADRALFTYADVPYRLADHEAMVADPQDTITFDEARQAAVDGRVERVGSDGRLVVDRDGDLVRVTLLEKLLVAALGRLSAYVPHGGIWMNTQRPEWNDANNALAGNGLSRVTLMQLEPYLALVAELLAERGDADVALSPSVAAWLDDVAAALSGESPASDDDHGRRSLLDAVSTAGERHRSRVASGVDASPASRPSDAVATFLADALRHVRASVATARRDDGMFHAYSLVAFPTHDTAVVTHLPLMLEGQVAALGTSAVDGPAAVELVDRLVASPLHRQDVGTFVLYPPDPPAAFLDRNTIPQDAVDRTPVLRRLVGDGRAAVVTEDGRGRLHFGPTMSNADAVTSALARHEVSQAEVDAVLEVYEQLFDHHAFTGRSGTMHGYEGLGSVYWHMVGKLLVAVQERYLAAEAAGVDEAVLERLAGAYRTVRDGLGFRRGPAAYGAVPTDCYSHTPAHSGAQQPGMTGEVKEELLARWGELGLVLRGGRLGRVRPLLPPDELYAADGTASVTVAGTPVRLVRADGDEVVVTRADGTRDHVGGRWLDAATTAAVLDRHGSVASVEWRTNV